MFENYIWGKDLPDENLEVYEPNMKLFFESMYERQIIWKKRFIEEQPAPWTDDEILTNSKFTNVYRELDRNSQWQINNILLDDSLNTKNLIWKLMVFRIFNNPNTFEKGKKLWGKNGIPDWEKYDIKEFENFIEEVKANGDNPFTNAYLINSAAMPGKSRNWFYTNMVIPTLHKSINEIVKTLIISKDVKDIIKLFNQLPGVANFVSHEFFQDFTYISRYTNRKIMKFDQNDYTNVGPGASVGIRLIYPNLKGKEQINGIYQLREESLKYLKQISKEKGEDFPFLYFNKETKKYELNNKNNITLHQIEMWLCEFQKYWKMKIGKGKQRSKFIPITKEITLI